MTWTEADTALRIAVPDAFADKHRRGVLGAITGSDRYPGAAVLGVEAAHRTGVGMVRLIAPRRVEDLVLARRPEAVTGEGRVEAWLVGSGQDARLRSPSLAAALRSALASGAPVVLDAGALDLASEAAGAAVVTPHHGELVRMLADLGIEASTEDVRLDPAAWARRAAEAIGAVVLLKGAESVVGAPDGRIIRVPPATHWLATAGSGDVLAGILGALVATHAGEVHADAGRLAELAASAAVVHGLAAQRASGGGPIAALDVAEAVPATIAGLLSR